MCLGLCAFLSFISVENLSQYLELMLQILIIQKIWGEQRLGLLVTPFYALENVFGTVAKSFSCKHGSPTLPSDDESTIGEAAGDRYRRYDSFETHHDSRKMRWSSGTGLFCEHTNWNPR